MENNVSLCPTKKSRHCAFCLIPISQEKVKLCGKCHRRAYCSRECQVMDWTDKFPSDQQSPRGQGHKNWCSLSCGEEDLEWEVSPVNGKGLGLIALKPIPARYRIIVEACQLTSSSHCRIQDLMPEGNSLTQKWTLNRLGCGAGDDVSNVLCLRISRANHDCRANAGHIYCNTFKVKILFSERDIEVGEEICISYSPFNSTSSSTPSSFNLCMLKLHWGVHCNAQCICQDPSIIAEIEKAKNFDMEILNLGSRGCVEQSLKRVDQLMTLHDQIFSSFLDKKRTLWDGFQVGIMKRKTISHGMKYISQLDSIMSDILHPKSSQLLEDRGYKDIPASHENYLLHE